MNWHRTAKEICKFVREHYKPWRNSQMRPLRDYFRWYAERNLLSVVWCNGRIAAVGATRFFYRLEDYHNEFVNLEDGPLCRCELYGAIHPLFIPQVVAKMAKGRNEHKAYMWHRKGETKPRIYSESQFKRILLLMVNYYGRRRSTNPT